MMNGELWQPGPSRQMYGNQVLLQNLREQLRYPSNDEVKRPRNAAIQAAANNLASSIQQQHVILQQQIQNNETMTAMMQQRLPYNTYHQQQQPDPQWNNQAAINNQVMQ